MSSPTVNLMITFAGVPPFTLVFPVGNLGKLGRVSVGSAVPASLASFLPLVGARLD